MKPKKFDCVAMKHAAAEKIQGQLKGKSIEEQLAFWQSGEQELFAKCRGVVSSLPIEKAA